MRRETYSLRSVAEDLEYLRDAWRDGANDADLRRGAAILRRFLVDGGNGVVPIVWRELGFEGQPIVVGPSISPAAIAARDRVILATAGGAAVNGIDTGGYLRMTTPFEDDFNPDGHEQDLLNYMAAPCIIVHGYPLTRRQLVTYFANYLGGVHVSRKVLKTREEIVRLFQQIEDLPVQTHLVGKDLLHFELLAIGQAIGQSKDCQKLATTIRTRVS